MSHHDATRYPQYNTPAIREALKQHGLAVDTPSQLSDSFRHGYLAALASAPPAAEPASAAFVYTDGTLSLEREVLDAIGVYARSRPESDNDDESWESWFEAAFDLATSRVKDVFREMALRQPESAQPATQAGAGERHGDPVRQAFIRGWDERGKAHQLRGSETTDRFMNQLLGIYYPRNAVQPTEQPSQDANPPR